MSTNLPVPAPSCPGCGSILVGDRKLRACPRCGRAFTIAIASEPVGAVYREMPRVDLVEVTEKAPLFGVRQDGGVGIFDVSIGGAWLTSGRVFVGFALAAVAVATDMLGLVAVPTLIRLVCTLPVACDMVLTAFKPRDRVFVKDGFLVCQRRRDGRVYFEERLPLAEIAGVYCENDYVRIESGDGTEWHVGEGLRAPRSVCRWLAQQIAQLLPPPGASAGADESRG